jgi:hypothetical protein
MDYLDNKKELRERIILFIGYILIAIAIVTATLLLVYQAYGFGFTKNGSVIQNGLVFFSSQPSPAKIYINNTLNSQNTDARLILPSGIYHIKINRSGYRTWQRTVTIDGGAVEHFDYPFLFPSKLTSQKLATYTNAPGLVTQSPSRRWLLIQKPGSSTDFDLYDLKNPAKPVVSTISVPSTMLGKAVTSQSYKLVAWSDDNQRVLLEHMYDNNIEYILFDINNPSQTVNLTNTYNLVGDEITLNNEKYNNYYFFNPTSGDLDSASLGNTTVTTVLKHVLNYKSYGTSTILYATSEGATKGDIIVKLLDNSQTYNIRSFPAGSSNYLVDLTTYGGSLYVAVGSSSYDRVYIYQDPVGQLSTSPDVLVPTWVLRVNQANYLSFSDNAQFIMTENGDKYAVYDIQNNLGYLYTDKTRPLDAPQTNATWMDGDRLIYVSNSKLIVQDYDNNNMQTLVNASPNYLPAFSSNFKYLFNLVPSASSAGAYDLNETPLQTSADL